MGFSDSSSPPSSSSPPPSDDSPQQPHPHPPVTMPRLSPQKRKRCAYPNISCETPETISGTNGPAQTTTLRCTSSEKLIGHFRRMSLDSEATIMADEYDTDDVVMEEKPLAKRICEGKKPLDTNVENAAAAKARRSRPPPADAPLNDKAPWERRRLKSPPPEKLNRATEGEEAVQDNDDLSSDPDVYGIAYIPTPAQRQIRSQKRMQQIKDYKSRESKAARDKRTAERRRRRSQTRTTNKAAETNNKKAVHFNL